MIKIPETIDEIMLLQPNNITFGQYELSEMQENVLTLIIDSIQDHVTDLKELPRDLFNQPYVEIACDDAGGKNSKHQVKKAVRDMFKKEFGFRWVHPEIHKTIETTGTIITTMHDIKGTNKLQLNFNIWAIPFFIYFGKGVGGTRFNKKIALSLRGDYTKRIYKMICRWQDKNHFTYDIETFKKDLGIPESYNNSQIKQKVLDLAKERIQETSSDVWFDYEMKPTKKPKKGRKPKNDTIYFYIKTGKPIEAGGEQEKQYRIIYSWLSRCYGSTSSKARDVIDILTMGGHLQKVYERIMYWEGEISIGNMPRKKAENSLKVMLFQDYEVAKK
jgi:hypothetical protein